MMSQQSQEITPQIFQQQMAQLKRRIAQVQGETQQMNADTMTDTLNQIMQMVNQLFTAGAAKDRNLSETLLKLEKCYNAHPELKISEEADAKKAKEKAAKIAKKV